MAKQRQDHEEFGEFMPAYMDQAKLFNDAPDDTELHQARRALGRQVGWIVLQVLLFAFLIKNTLNLG